MLEVRHRVLSEPAEVHWAGFRSDTYRLQQAGWEIAADEDVEYRRIRLLLRHQDMKLYALTNDQAFEYQREYYSGHYAPRSLVFNVVAASPNFQIRQVAMPTFENFRQIDAKPQVVETQIKSLDDFKIFATPLVRTEEIIVEPETVARMLEKIREMQAPEQAALREKHRRALSSQMVRADGASPRQTFHAQIISLAERRA